MCVKISSDCFTPEHHNLWISQTICCLHSNTGDPEPRVDGSKYVRSNKIQIYIAHVRFIQLKPNSKSTHTVLTIERLGGDRVQSRPGREGPKDPLY